MRAVEHVWFKSLSENRLGEGDSPILLRGLRKIGTVPDRSWIGSKPHQDTSRAGKYKPVLVIAWKELASMQLESALLLLMSESMLKALALKDYLLARSGCAGV